MRANLPAPALRAPNSAQRWFVRHRRLAHHDEGPHQLCRPLRLHTAGERRSWKAPGAYQADKVSRRESVPGASYVNTRRPLAVAPHPSRPLTALRPSLLRTSPTALPALILPSARSLSQNGELIELEASPLAGSVTVPVSAEGDDIDWEASATALAPPRRPEHMAQHERSPLRSGVANPLRRTPLQPVPRRRSSQTAPVPRQVSHLALPCDQRRLSAMRPSSGT